MIAWLKIVLVMGGAIALLIGVIKIKSCQLEKAKEAVEAAQTQAEIEHRKAVIKEKDLEDQKKIDGMSPDDVLDGLRHGGLPEK